MNRHPSDMVALILGGALLGVVAVWALVKTVTLGLPGAGWFIAGVLVVVGLVGIVTVLRPSRR